MAVVLLYSSVHHSKGHPLWGLSPLVRCQCQHVGRESAVRTPPHACDSAVFPCLYGCLAFLQVHSLLRSPPSHPLRLSPQNKQQSLPWGCSPIPMLQLPATYSGGLVSLSMVCRAMAWIVRVVLTPLRLSQISCFTLWKPQMLSLCPNWLPTGDLPFAAALIPQGRRFSSPTLLLFFPYFLHSTTFCVYLCIPFWWPRIPASSQLVLCETFCVWRYIPVASVEKNVVHVHLHFQRLVSPLCS